MTKRITLKEYSEWLFEEQNSIIYEKNMINEGVGDLLADFGQAALAGIGTIPPLEATGAAEAADTLNALIYASRGQYVNCLLSLISVAPVVGDALGKSGMVLNFLRRVIQSGGKAGQVATWTLQNLPRLQSSLRTLANFVKNNKTKIKLALEYAGRRFEELRAQRSSGQSNVATNAPATALNEEDVSSLDIENLPAPVKAIFDYILRTPQFARYFENSTFIQNMKRAVDSVEKLFNDALELVGNIRTANSEERDSETSESSNTETALNEARFKKLAGIIE